MCIFVYNKSIWDTKNENKARTWSLKFIFYFCQWIHPHDKAYTARDGREECPRGHWSWCMHYFMFNFPDIQFNLFSTGLDTKSQSVFIDQNKSTLLSRWLEIGTLGLQQRPQVKWTYWHFNKIHYNNHLMCLFIKQTASFSSFWLELDTTLLYFLLHCVINTE